MLGYWVGVCLSYKTLHVVPESGFLPHFTRNMGAGHSASWPASQFPFAMSLWGVAPHLNKSLGSERSALGTQLFPELLLGP